MAKIPERPALGAARAWGFWLVGAVLLGLSLPNGAAADSRDEDVFAARVPPNVALFVDNSGSMNTMMEHASYDQVSATWSCDPFDTPTIENAINANGYYWNDYPDDNGDTVRVYCWDHNANSCRVYLHTTVLSGYTRTSNPDDHPDTGYVEREFCGNTRKIWNDGKVNQDWYYTYVLGPYFAWLFNLDDSDDTTLIGPPGAQMTPQDIVAEIDDSTNQRNFITGDYFGKYQRARISAAREIASDVIYRTNTNCPAYTPSCTAYEDNVRFGLAIFDPFSHGGYLKVPIDEYSTNRTSLESNISAIEAQTATPLAETLFKLYTYFMSRSSSDRPFGQNGSTRFPGYGYRTSDGAWVGTTSAPASPITAECQQNFVIMVTDGEPTADDFDNSGSSRGTDFGNFNALIGDYFADAAGDPDTPETGNPPWPGSGTGYLDDVAAFMQDNDFRPDYPSTTNKIDTYTVGFTTQGVVNDLLRKTAANGNGLFFTGNQSDILTEALVSSVEDIISKSQGFSAATVPAARTAEGGNLYTSLFQPDGSRAFWPGELRSYTINAAGEILDRDGNCALENLTVAGSCTGGTFQNESAAPPHWNAREMMPVPNARNLYFSEWTGSQHRRQDWAQGDVPHADLGVAGESINDYPPSASVTDQTTLAQAIISYVGGCEWGTGMTAAGTDAFSGCTPRTTVSGGNTIPDRLGDIFHSNPVVVGAPSAYIPEPSYAAFTIQTDMVHRERLIYAGANDGFLHAFNAGDWDSVNGRYDTGTGVERFAFMPWAALPKVKRLAKTSSTVHPLTVDGSPAVGDVWIDRNSNPDDDKRWDEWKTVLISGMREGGSHYFALDITDPSDAAFPEYMWEFPRADDTSWLARFGETWSQPVITRVRVEDSGGDVFEKWVAIITFGYDARSDPNTTSYGNTNLQGRGIAMLDIESGRPLAVRKYGTSATGDVSDMHYAIASTPAVLDYDQDGFADIVYVGDVGGNIWKWVIRAHGIKDPTSAQLYQANWPFRKFFSADPTRPQGARARSFFFPAAATLVNGILHVGLGSGERADMSCATADGCTLGNRFYVLKDRDVWDQGAPSPIDGRAAPTGDLTDVTPDENNCPTVAPSGFFFTVPGDGEKFVTNTEVFNAFFFSSTFTPDGTNVCEPSGSSLLYGFLAKCGQGFFGPPSAISPIANSDRSLDLGTGVPTDARLSIAPGSGSNRLIISKQDGEIVNIESGSSSAEHGTLYWRELD